MYFFLLAASEKAANAKCLPQFFEVLKEAVKAINENYFVHFFSKD